MGQHDTSAATAGWDWANDSHVLSVVDSDGVEVRRREISHTGSGLQAACRWLEVHEVDRVGIERPDGPVIDALLDAGFEVVVIPPRQVRGLRGRYGSAGNKDDHFDAFVLADALRTDAARLTPLQPDRDETVALRSACRARKDLIASRVAICNRLREHLKRVFPGAVGLFGELDSPISVAFLQRFPSAEEAAWLSEKRLANWLSTQGYCGGKDPGVLYGRLAAAPAGVTGPVAKTHAQITVSYIETLHTIRRQAKTLRNQITAHLEAHPDGEIFKSFPRSGTVRAARLLAEMGDCRARFPTPESFQGLAGVVPSTRQSGARKVAAFRYACDKQLRDALVDFVSDSRHTNPWAAKIYNDARARNKTHPHAERILARAWSYIIWRCWQDNTTYKPAKHGALQRLLQPKTAVA